VYFRPLLRYVYFSVRRPFYFRRLLPVTISEVQYATCSTQTLTILVRLKIVYVYSYVRFARNLWLCLFVTSKPLCVYSYVTFLTKFPLCIQYTLFLFCVRNLCVYRCYVGEKLPHAYITRCSLFLCSKPLNTPIPYVNHKLRALYILTNVAPFCAMFPMIRVSCPFLHAFLFPFLSICRNGPTTSGRHRYS
jgi:hypothetical protein